MKTTLIGRWLEKNNKPFVALLAAGATLAMATLIDASSSSQVEQVGSLAVPRTGHAATALADGRVLITGGRDGAGIIVATAEVFDPANQTSTAIGVLNTARIDHTATLLANGRILIAGGTGASGALTSAEIFDPANPGAGFRVLSATMGATRARHTATLLNNGTVLIAGGDAAGTAEIFNPATEAFSSTLLAMAAPRIGHTAILFSDDSVLLAGGNTDSMEYFSATDQKFTLDLQKMTAVRTGQEAIALDDTHLLFFGGDSGNTIDEFNSSSDTITLKGTMDAPASSATLLANGKILVLRSDVAGLYAPDAADQNSAFIPFDETSVPGSTALRRTGQTATELSGDKKILVAGGENAQHQPTLQIAMFNPARIWTDKDDYMPTEPVLLFGSGWKPNENVYLFAVDSETEQWTYGSTETADAQGSFAVEPYFIIEMRHLGTVFDVTAVGAQSNMQADVQFTDAGISKVTVVGAQTPSPVVPGNTVSYGNTAANSVNVTFNGNNNTCSVTLSASGLPAGATATFSPSSFSSTGAQMNSLLTVTTNTAVAPGTYNFTVTANAGGNCQGSSASTGATLVVANPPAKYVVSSSDSNPVAGTAVTISAQLADAGGLPVPIAGKVVTWGKTGSGGSFSAGTSTTNANGVATVLFTTGTTAGTVYTVTATDNSSPTNFTGTTGNITTKAGAASKLLLSGSTADLAAGATRQLTATIQDPNNNVVTSGADSTLSVTFAKTSGTGTVTGLGSSTASAGVATLTVTGNVAGPITITASATGSGGALAPGNGNPITFNVTAGAASKLALSGSTANLTAGATRTLTATIQDAGGNTIATGPDSSLSVLFAKTTGSGTVTGLGSATAVAGVANITVTGATAGSITIGASGTASGGPLTAGSGNPITFTVVASTTVDHFAFAPISSPQSAGTAFNITITAQDAGNNTVTGYSGNGFKVKLTSTGTFSASTQTTTPAFTNGILTNHSVTIANTGNFTITATDNSGGGTATGTSNSFQVNAGAATKLAFIQQPTTTTAGQTIAPAVTVQVQDANDNLTNSTASVAIAIANNPSSGTLSGTTPVAAVNGTATFSDPSINKGGTGYTLQATSAGLTSATSAAFNINNPAPTLTSIAPTSGNISDTLDVVFNGTNYISGVTTVNFGANITVNSVTVNSSIKLTANITIGSGATVGPRNVSVTNPAPGGGTATLTNGFTVNNPATTTVVTSSSIANTSTYGESVTFTAMVSTASGTPTGSITFYDSASCSGTILAGPTNLDANGKASFTTTSLSAPGHTITGCYTPTGIYLASNGNVTQTVNKAHLTVTADDKSKTYDGHIFTAFTSKITGFVNGETSSVLSGAAAYTGDATGAINAGSYTITPTIGTLSATNYDFTVFNNATLTIDKADATWTTNPNSKTYGDNDPNPLTTGSGLGFAATDNVTATYSRAAGESVAGGPYHITAMLSPVSVLTNYNITNAGASFTINTRPATWTTNPNSKTYGDNDPSPLTTGSGSGFLTADNVTATYSRAAGETVAGGPYHITATLSPAAVLSNYDITNAGASFTINARPATWTTNPNSKSYGDNDPNPLTTGSGDFLAADNVTATYSRTAGETVLGGPYHITATLNAAAGVLANYIITNAGASFTINARPATWTTHANSKTYGDNDPNPLTTGSGDFLAADNVTATYSRVAGENAGPVTYHITATLAPSGVLSNYSITNAGAEFTVNKRPATWTTNDNSKTYGEADPDPVTTGSAVTPGPGTGFLAADGITATYSRVAGEKAGPPTYHITATLAPLAALDNYIITNNGAEFTINKRPATWTTNANSKVYGEVDPNPVTTGSALPPGPETGFLAADSVTATYSRALGETVLGGPYHITATLSPAEVLDNYIVTNEGASFTINARPASWTTNGNSKTYGDADPNPLTTGGGVAPGPGTGFLAADNITASYNRAPGETVLGGPYHITATLSPSAVLSNYNITNMGASFTINARPATWTTNPNSKTYGDMDPSPLTTGSGSNFVAADNVTATYSRAAGETVLGGPYHISAILAPAGVLSNYSITNAGADFIINPRPATVKADNKTKTYGDDNPMLTAIVTGTVNNDTLSYSLATTALKFSNVADYPITVTLGSNPNYTVTPTNGTLTVNKANQTITWANPAAIILGTPLSGTQLNATVAGVAGGTPPGALTYTPPAGTVLGVGANQPLKVDAAATINYNAATKTVYINVNYSFIGFLQPIDNLPIVNSVKAGQTIPVKWQLKDAVGNLIDDVGSLAPSGLQSVRIACSDGTPQDVIEELASPGSTVFRFDGTQFIFNWQTSKSWAGTCRMMTVTLKDGKVYSAQFTFK